GPPDASARAQRGRAGRALVRAEVVHHAQGLTAPRGRTGWRGRGAFSSTIGSNNRRIGCACRTDPGVPVFPRHPLGTRSAGFWLVVLAATANYTVLSASAPLITRAASDVLGAG